MEQQLQQKIDFKTKPRGSLGKLERIALQIGLVQQSLSPCLNKPTLLVFAADHGLAHEGVSPFPKEVTYQMVMNFVSGGAAINVFCRQNGMDLKVVDAGVDYDFPADMPIVHAKIARGTNNILKTPAMDNETCRKAIEKGAGILASEQAGGCNVIGFGEMGIGNTSSAALLMHKITGFPIEECTGRGTGLDDAGLQHKIEVLKKAAEKHRTASVMEILATFGGLEIAMMTGAMLEARKRGMVILVDGFISSAAMLVASAMDAHILFNTIFCHTSEEKGHKKMLDFMNAEPLINIGMRLGEGSGIAVAFPIIKSSIAFLNEMASFESAGVSKGVES
jgi:nicotinate-nucleotide--dimethylbenzimidazole phosphoribosyltransferase